MPQILRNAATAIVTFAANTSASEPVYFAEWAGGVVHMPAVWTTAGLGFGVSSSREGTYQTLYDDSETPALVQVLPPLASRSFPLPTSLYGCKYFKFWSHSIGLSVVQAVGTHIIVDRKG